MALHPNFPRSPYEVLDPGIRWFPADEVLREKGSDKLMPPLVPELRKKVKEWRDDNYTGASETSISLLNWWFKTPHVAPKNNGSTFEFKYYFAQREAVETIIYLHDVARIKDKYDLIRFDVSGQVYPSLITENWKRYVIKMATGSGKTKVLSLLIAWCYYHKLYESDSDLARNFILIAPNIIVLDRLRSDFDGLKIFHEDPILPDEGYGGHNWHDDFNFDLHIQDEVKVTNKFGNLFLTNIHRVYDTGDKTPAFADENTADYFLGVKPVGATNESKLDLGEIIKDVDELAIFNDEAHHIHDEKMAWFKSIENIHNRLLMKGGSLALQIDVTATPKHNNGAIFVQTVSDYPLVEAIHQNVVKHPTVPDSASRAKLSEKTSSKFTEKYSDFIDLGYKEWKKVFEEHSHIKKPILFLMTDDTKNCDEVAQYLEVKYPDLKGGVLVIHTKDNGEIAENPKGKDKDELDKLRKQANEIDSWDSPYKAIVSVLMLKEGWDVKNVTTIVGLRAYSSKSNILPEQTLGRGLRRMYRDNADLTEYVSVVGTPAFMDFVESIKSEGVILEHKAMGDGTGPTAPVVIEVDRENFKKDIEKLDIEIPVLSPRIYREYKNLSNIDPSKFVFDKVEYKSFGEEEKREIVFKDITSDEVTHVNTLDTLTITDYQSVVGYFAKIIMNELRLVSGFDIICDKVKSFIQSQLFGRVVDLSDLNTLRNLSEIEASRTVIEIFKKNINELTVLDKGEAEIRDYIKVSNTRPFVANQTAFMMPKKSVFSKVVGDSLFELEFAGFLDTCEDIISYTKNFMSVHFKIDYKNADGEIKDYYPDFVVKVDFKTVYIIELKGAEDLDDIQKVKRLAQWCEDVNKISSGVKYHSLYIMQETYNKYKPQSFSQVVDIAEKE